VAVCGCLCAAGFLVEVRLALLMLMLDEKYEEKHQMSK
jgi:hypothetical protein